MEVLILKVVGDVAAHVVHRDHVAQALVGDGDPIVTVANNGVLAYMGLVARAAAADVLQVARTATAEVNAGAMAATYDAVQYSVCLRWSVPKFRKCHCS